MPAGTLRETQSASRVGLESDVKALFVGGLRCVADDDDLVKRCGQLVLVGLVRPVAERHDDDVGIDADGLAAGELLELDGPLADAGERVLRAPDDGIFHQLADIGARVQAGDVVGEVNGKPMACTIAGVIRGMLADGTPVYKGMKSGDVDPRGELSYCYTASDKAIAIGGGVLQAILEYTGVLSNVTGQNAWEV